jgi:GNAT superfamily N-acetyltransferase
VAPGPAINVADTGAPAGVHDRSVCGGLRHIVSRAERLGCRGRGTRVARALKVEFRDAAVDDGGIGEELVQAMRQEVNAMYPGIDLTASYMPAGGPAELSPPGGAFIVGWLDREAVCCGGVKRLGDGACEIKRMYVVPGWRGRGVSRQLLYSLEAKALELGYAIARLDTGPKQQRARGLYESEGYVSIDDFNGNPVAAFWGEKRLVGRL